LPRVQVSGVVVSVIATSRSFGTRINAMEVQTRSQAPSAATAACTHARAGVAASIQLANLTRDY
jgi:hypothetical protein